MNWRYVMRILRIFFVFVMAFTLMMGALGCNTKSIEMTLNDGILENDYFSIDVSGYEEINYTKDSYRAGNDYTIGEVIGMFHEDGKGAYQYIEIRGVKNSKDNVPNEARMRMEFESSGGEILNLEYINGDPNLGIIVETLHIKNNEHFSNYYDYYTEIHVKIDNTYFAIYLTEADGTEEIFPAYTTAIDSFKLK